MQHHQTVFVLQMYGACSVLVHLFEVVWPLLCWCNLVIQGQPPVP